MFLVLVVRPLACMILSMLTYALLSGSQKVAKMYYGVSGDGARGHTSENEDQY